MLVAPVTRAEGPTPPASQGPLCAPQASRHASAPTAETLFALASCHETAGRTASAWAEFLEAASLAAHTKKPTVEAVSKQRASAVETRLSKLEISVGPDSDSPSLEVRRDGVVVPRAAWGTALPIDPGEHRVEASAAGKQPWRRTVVVRAGSRTQNVVVGPLQNDPRNAAVAAVPVAASKDTPVATATTTTTSADLTRKDLAPSAEENRGSTQRTLALVVAGAGVAGLAAGTYFGVQAIDKSDSAKRVCPNSPCSDRAAVDLNDEARRSATLSTVSLAAGGTALLVGGLLYFTAPKNKPSVGLSAAPGYAGLRFEGTFQ